MDGAEFESQKGQEIFTFARTTQTGSGAHPASQSISTGVLSRRQNGWGLKLTTHIRLMLKLRISGVTMYPNIGVHGADRGNLTCTTKLKLHIIHSVHLSPYL
jgi:hypothetical protein